MGILAYDTEKGVFWIIIFGWSGIAATFCPVMILSLFWSGLTAKGARCAMVAGFLGVPFFKFVAPMIFANAGLDELNTHLTNLDVIAPVVRGVVRRSFLGKRDGFARACGPRRREGRPALRAAGRDQTPE